MSFGRPAGLIAGFHADTPDPLVPELYHIGEQWVPRHLKIGTHTHHVWEFYLQLDGTSIWDGPTRSYDVHPGTFFAAPPNVPHSLRLPVDAKHHFYFAAIDLLAVIARLPELSTRWQGSEILCVADGESVQGPFRQLIREVALGLPHRSLGLKLSLDYLVLEATRVVSQENHADSYVSIHPAVRMAKDLMDHQPGQPWHLDDLAKITGVSKQHLSELFARDIGTAPRQYLLQIRIARACEMLAQSDVSITDLALELGFCSSQHFASVFRQVTGMSAREYRNRE